MTWERIRTAGVSGRDWIQDGLGGAARRVQDLTGLKVLEAIGGRRGAATANTSEVAVEKAEGALQSAGDAAGAGAAEARQPDEKAVEKKGEEGRQKP